MAKNLFLQLCGMTVAVRHRGEVRILLGLVASQHQQVGDAEELQVDEDVLRLLPCEPAAEDVWHDGDAEVLLDGCRHSDRAGSLPYGYALEESLACLPVDALAAVCGDIDVLWIELAQHFDVRKKFVNPHSLQRGQDLEREERR